MGIDQLPAATEATSAFLQMLVFSDPLPEIHISNKAWVYEMDQLSAK